jgi:hypothetical protein
MAAGDGTTDYVGPPAGSLAPPLTNPPMVAAGFRLRRTRQCARHLMRGLRSDTDNVAREPETGKEIDLPSDHRNRAAAAASSLRQTDRWRAMSARLIQTMTGRNVTIEPSHQATGMVVVRYASRVTSCWAKQQISTTQPGALSPIVNVKPCRLTTAATRFKPRPAPLVCRLLSER